MYRIKRNYQSAKKQQWLVELLVKIKPIYFAPMESMEESRNALNHIEECIRKAKVSWRRGLFNLSYIRDIQVLDDEIIISYKNGKPCVSFKIEKMKTECL